MQCTRGGALEEASRADARRQLVQFPNLRAATRGGGAVGEARGNRRDFASRLVELDRPSYSTSPTRYGDGGISALPAVQHPEGLPNFPQHK